MPKKEDLQEKYDKVKEQLGKAIVVINSDPAEHGHYAIVTDDIKVLQEFTREAVKANIVKRLEGIGFVYDTFFHRWRFDQIQVTFTQTQVRFWITNTPPEREFELFMPLDTFWAHIETAIREAQL